MISRRKGTDVFVAAARIAALARSAAAVRARRRRQRAARRGRGRKRCSPTPRPPGSSASSAPTSPPSSRGWDIFATVLAPRPVPALDARGDGGRAAGRRERRRRHSRAGRSPATGSLVAPDDPAALADAIVAMAALPAAEREAIGAAGAGEGREREFTLEGQVEGLDAAYRAARRDVASRRCPQRRRPRSRRRLPDLLPRRRADLRADGRGLSRQPDLHDRLPRAARPIIASRARDPDLLAAARRPHAATGTATRCRCSRGRPSRCRSPATRWSSRRASASPTASVRGRGDPRLLLPHAVSLRLARARARRSPGRPRRSRAGSPHARSTGSGRWDLEASKRVTHYVANSEITRARIAEFYGREAEISTRRSRSTASPSASREDYFLYVGELVSPQARRGRDRGGASWPASRSRSSATARSSQRCRPRTATTPTFLGRIGDAELAGVYSRALALVVPNVEEFGIAAVEAQASGRPVLALGAGGALETVVDGETGVLIDERERRRARGGDGRRRLHPLRARDGRAQCRAVRAGDVSRAAASRSSAARPRAPSARARCASAERVGAGVQVDEPLERELGAPPGSAAPLRARRGGRRRRASRPSAAAIAAGSSAGARKPGHAVLDELVDRRRRRSRRPASRTPSPRGSPSAFPPSAGSRSSRRRRGPAAGRSPRRPGRRTRSRRGRGGPPSAPRLDRGHVARRGSGSGRR